MARVIGIIPARYASSRFPGKMLAQLQGSPILKHTFNSASSSPILDQLIIATDDDRIRKIAEEFGAEVVMTSPSCPTGTDRIGEAIASLDLHPDDIVINIQGDEPCISPMAIEAVANKLLNDEGAVMSTALYLLTSSDQLADRSLVKCAVGVNQRALYFSRAPIPTPYGHIGIYGYRVHFLRTYIEIAPTPLQTAEDLEQLRALEHGYPIAVAIIPEAMIGVNTPEDLTRLEELLCSQNIYL